MPASDPQSTEDELKDRMSWLEQLVMDYVPSLLVARLQSDALLPVRSGPPSYDLTPAHTVFVAPHFGCSMAGGKKLMVPTGLAVDVPAGYMCYVSPLPSLLSRHKVDVVPQTLFPGEPQELHVRLANRGRERVTLTPNTPVAQLVLVKLEERVHVREVFPYDPDKVAVPLETVVVAQEGAQGEEMVV